eukprot:gene8468-biopygen10333
MLHCCLPRDLLPTNRHPDDIQQILSRDGSAFKKSSRVSQSHEWLGEGLFSQIDYFKHAAMRQTLNPAFRMDYLKQLDSVFVATAGQLAELLTAVTGAADGCRSSERNNGQAATTAAAEQTQVFDMQKLFKLMNLDSIGLTSMSHEFHALATWQQQQQRWQQLQQHLNSSVTINTTTSSSSTGISSYLDLEQVLVDLSSAFFWQSLQLPVPRSWLPGWRKYISACEQLDQIVYAVIKARKTAPDHQQLCQQECQQQQQLKPVGRQDRQGHLQRQGRDILGYLLSAQQQQGSDALTDDMVADELKTMMFAGADTSSFTMAYLAYLLACHPAASAAAAREVQQLLKSTGRTTNDGSGDVMLLNAEDVARLPFLTGCLNETMRLAPAGAVLTRTAAQASFVCMWNALQSPKTQLQNEHLQSTCPSH